MPKTATRTRPSTFTCTAEVEIDASDLAEAGYHHEDECGLYPVDEAEFEPEPDWELNGAARAIHKQAGHRLADVAACGEEPCRSLPLDTVLITMSSR